MRYRYILLAALPIGSIPVIAQPTLGNQNVPVTGMSFDVYRAAYVDPGAAGSWQTWDFSALTDDDTLHLQWVDPITTPNGSMFPTATVAWDDQLGRNLFYKTTGAGLEMVGTDSLDIQIPYSDAALYLPFPCTFGTTWSDNFAATYIAFGSPVARTGIISGNGDAHGDLIMPYGPVNDVLRVQTQENIHDVAPLGTIDVAVLRYSFYETWLRLPLVSIVTTSLSLNGGAPAIYQYTEWVNGATVGLAEQQVQHGRLNVFPIPANDLLNVELVDMQGPVTVDILDAVGRVVLTERSSSATLLIALDELLPGAYSLRAIDARGAFATRRLIVE